MASEAIPRETEELQTITEGQAQVLLTSNHVFYNPVQEFNRDLSIAVLRTFIQEIQKTPPKKDRKNKNISIDDKDKENKKISILEALSATGLRSIRYAREIPGVDRIVANDISAKAVESIAENIKLNNVHHIVETSHNDAVMVMYQNRAKAQRFTAVDLDPYGCPSQFLDGAVQSVQDGGLLLVTATDMAVLAGNSPETCYSKYGAVSLKTKACHEQALRILLQCIESHANRYGRYIVPVLSVSADFYIRVFVVIFSGPVHCKKTTSKLSMMFQCVGCETFHMQPLGEFKPNPSPHDESRTKASLPHAPPISPNCEHCNQRFHMGGPIWTGPLHESEFVDNLLHTVRSEPEKFKTSKRIEGILSMVQEELHDVPLYYTMDKLCSKLHMEMMPMLALRSAIINSGYRVSYSHACKTSIKTDAPPKLLWDIMRKWEKTHPVSKSRLNDVVTQTLLSHDANEDVDLTERSDANPASRKDGFLRFQYNPTPYWGPGTRGTANTGEEKMSKSKRNQNKKSANKNDDSPTKKRERSTESAEEDRKHVKVDSNE